MSTDKYFKAALADFAFDAAYGDSIRHLHNRGFTPEEIKDHLEADSLSLERITEVIEKHERENINDTCDYEIVKEYDSYGRASFVRKKVSHQ